MGLIVKTADLQRAFRWSEKYQNNNRTANYFFNICVTLGIFSQIKEPSSYDFFKDHCNAETSLCSLRDKVAKQILMAIKGQRI